MDNITYGRIGYLAGKVVSKEKVLFTSLDNIGGGSISITKPRFSLIAEPRMSLYCWWSPT